YYVPGSFRSPPPLPAFSPVLTLQTASRQEGARSSARTTAERKSGRERKASAERRRMRFMLLLPIVRSQTAVRPDVGRGPKGSLHVRCHDCRAVRCSHQAI